MDLVALPVNVPGPMVSPLPSVTKGSVVRLVLLVGRMTTIPTGAGDGLRAFVNSVRMRLVRSILTAAGFFH